MTDIATNEPLKLRVGDTWKWNRQDLSADYPATVWTLKYAFKNAASHFEFNASADGAYFAVSVAKATTAGYTAGTYQWVAYVTDGTSQYTVDDGELEVQPSYSATTAAARDDRSHARIVLDAIEAVIEGRASLDQQEYSIGNRMLKRMMVADLIKFRETYRGYVRAEQLANNVQNGKDGSRLVVKL